MGRAAFRTAAREYKKSGLKSVLESDLDLTSKVFQGTISGVGWSLRKGASMASSAVGSGLNAIHNATMPTTMAASAIDGALAKSMAGGISAGSAGGFDSGISGVKGVVTNSNFGSEGRQGSTASDKKETGQDVKIENMVSEGSAKKKLQAAEESANAVIKAEELVEKKREERKKENEKANEIKRAEEAEKDRIAKENEKRIEEAKGEHSITTASVANMDSPVGEKTPDIPKPPYNTLDSYPDFGNLFQQSIATNPNPSTNP